MAAELWALDIAGLMSSSPIDTVIGQSRKLHRFALEMGFSRDPFAALSFLALPVIPVLRLTDKGLVDVNRFGFVEISVNG